MISAESDSNMRSKMLQRNINSKSFQCHFVGAWFRVKRGSWGIGGKASQQARSVGTYRCTACENEKLGYWLKNFLEIGTLSPFYGTRDVDNG